MCTVELITKGSIYAHAGFCPSEPINKTQSLMWDQTIGYSNGLWDA